MNEVFADTSGWGAFFVRAERFHAAAVAQVRELSQGGAQVVTTNYVLAELVALFIHPIRLAHFQQVRIMETIKTTPWVSVIHVDPMLDEEAWALWKRREDKNWSLVDCASFAVMQRRAITEALTTDHHFEQAGFRRLLV